MGMGMERWSQAAVKVRILSCLVNGGDVREIGESWDDDAASRQISVSRSRHNIMEGLMRSKPSLRSSWPHYALLPVFFLFDQILVAEDCTFHDDKCEG